MSRSYTSSPPKRSMACSGTALPLLKIMTEMDSHGKELVMQTKQKLKTFEDCLHMFFSN
jgi:hypothetical protein